MSDAKRETNLIVSEAVDTLEKAKALLGRIVGDRVIAHLVFSDHRDPDSLQDIYSLSTKRDLLFLAANRSVSRLAGSACPFLKKGKSGEREP